MGKVSIRSHTPSSHAISMEMDGPDWEQWFLLRSDVHHDNAHSDRDLELKHLREAAERGAYVLDNGDTLCLMQGKWDPRADTSACRPEHREGRYLDAVIRTAAEFYAPFGERFMLMAPGNHETAIAKRHETNMTERLVEALRFRAPESQVVSGSYANWIAFRAVQSGEQRANTVVMYMHHGYGGGGPVTRGTIQTARMAVYLPDAQLVWTGHTHDQWIVPIARHRLGSSGLPYNDRQVHFRAPGYKDEHSCANGWAVERGMPPKPKGALWLRFWLDRERTQHRVRSTRAVLRADITEAT